MFLTFGSFLEWAAVVTALSGCWKSAQAPYRMCSLKAWADGSFPKKTTNGDCVTNLFDTGLAILGCSEGDPGFLDGGSEPCLHLVQPAVCRVLELWGAQSVRGAPLGSPIELAAVLQCVQHGVFQGSFLMAITVNLVFCWGLGVQWMKFGCHQRGFTVTLLTSRWSWENITFWKLTK